MEHAMPAEHAISPEGGGLPKHSAGSDEPRSVGGYRLLRTVGEGGMSTVYLSYDVPARRAVAVKVLADHLAGQSEFVNRFYREARLSRLLQHDQIVQGYAAGFDHEANKHYLVLEFIDGPSSHTALTRLGRLPVGVAVTIGIDIARALQFLHGRNYVHRDVKPDNVLLHPEGGAKLADLGLTKRLSDDSHLTSLNQGVGTSYYMPYEQALNAALVDGRSDIFALGATLYHLLSGQVPFAGATHEEIVRGKEHDDFIPIEKLNAEVPAAVAEIIAKTLARDPRERYQTAEELAEALEATGLAMRIPSFAVGGSSEVAAFAELPGPDLPTRVDLPVARVEVRPNQTPLPPASDDPAPEAGEVSGPPSIVTLSGGASS
jgi:eukaryotic-like serine/threonine-protein kinase